MKYKDTEKNIIEFTVKETEGRTEYDTGAVRSDKIGKPKLSLLPWELFPRQAFHLEKGANIYGANNYKKGMKSSDYLDSALRHTQQYMLGMKDEDHASAVVFNWNGIMFNEMYYGDNPEIHDLPKSLEWGVR